MSLRCHSAIVWRQGLTTVIPDHLRILALMYLDSFFSYTFAALYKLGPHWLWIPPGLVLAGQEGSETLASQWAVCPENWGVEQLEGKEQQETEFPIRLWSLAPYLSEEQQPANGAHPERGRNCLSMATVSVSVTGRSSHMWKSPGDVNGLPPKHRNTHTHNNTPPPPSMTCRDSEHLPGSPWNRLSGSVCVSPPPPPSHPSASLWAP